MAFQPFVEAGTARIFGYEALVRGFNGERAGQILGKVNDSNRYQFDQACRVKAIELASELKLTGIFGSCVTVRSLATGRTVNVRINGRGPFVKNRIIDLSEAAARDLGMLEAGAGRVVLSACRQ